MARYRMEGCIVDTDRASNSWSEAEDHNGNNLVSRATKSQWAHEMLHRSRKGRYYKEYWSAYAETTSHAEWVSPEEAARWLLLMGHNLPDDLKHLEDVVCE